MFDWEDLLLQLFTLKHYKMEHNKTVDVKVKCHGWKERKKDTEEMLQVNKILFVDSRTLTRVLFWCFMNPLIMFLSIMTNGDN